MDSLSAAIPAKSTCQFKKDNGEFCRRIVNRPETMCWQHATTLRHKWKSLTRNQTVIFIATVLGLAVALVVGVPGTYFSYRGWHDLPKWKVPSIPTPVATPGKDTTPPTTTSTPLARKPPKHTKALTTPSPQPQAPDVSMTFYIEGGNPRFSIFNSGDEAAQQPKWSFALADLTNEYYPHYPSDPNSSQPLPIPTNKIDDYVKPHSYLGNFAVFNDATANVIKSGDQIFGFVGISCANCPGNRRYWLYWEVGNGGWYAHFIPLAKDAQLFKQGNLSRPEVDEKVSRTVPAIARIPLQNGSPWIIDLSQP